MNNKKTNNKENVFVNVCIEIQFSPSSLELWYSNNQPASVSLELRHFRTHCVPVTIVTKRKVLSALIVEVELIERWLTSLNLFLQSMV